MNMEIPKLPDWTRWSWASVDEREWWLPLFTQASLAFRELERWSVVAGIRPAAFINVRPEELVSATTWAREHGILCVPYTTSSATTHSYSSTSSSLVPGKPFEYRVLYVRPEYYAQTNCSTDGALGELLGYPSCCRQSFDQTWGKGRVDSTWEQTQFGSATGGPIGSNTLLRWMGIRLVSHMPCTFQCEPSSVIGKQMFELGLARGYFDEMMLIREVLQWPVEWSRLFGIAELITPGLKISTRSDWTPTKDMFTRAGTYNKPVKKWWTQNGFSSAESMRSAHQLLAGGMIDALPQNARVLDLGCGNGELLRRLARHRPDVAIAGVDINSDAIYAASVSFDKLGIPSKFWNASIETAPWSEWNPTVVLYTPGRLLEMTIENATQIRQQLRRIPLQFVYSYGDSLKHGSLNVLCQQAKLPELFEPVVKTPDVEMGIIRGSV